MIDCILRKLSETFCALRLFIQNVTLLGTALHTSTVVRVHARQGKAERNSDVFQVFYDVFYDVLTKLSKSFCWAFYCLFWSFQNENNVKVPKFFQQFSIFFFESSRNLFSSSNVCFWRQLETNNKKVQRNGIKSSLQKLLEIFSSKNISFDSKFQEKKSCGMSCLCFLTCSRRLKCSFHHQITKQKKSSVQISFSIKIKFITRIIFRFEDISSAERLSLNYLNDNFSLRILIFFLLTRQYRFIHFENLFINSWERENFNSPSVFPMEMRRRETGVPHFTVVVDFWAWQRTVKSAELCFSLKRIKFCLLQFHLHLVSPLKAEAKALSLLFWWASRKRRAWQSQ